jgi:hypothetical protein
MKSNPGMLTHYQQIDALLNLHKGTCHFWLIYIAVFTADRTHLSGQDYSPDVAFWEVAPALLLSLGQIVETGK